MTEIFRSYQLKNHSNQNKLDLLMDVLDMYRISAKQISNKQWEFFYKNGTKFNKNLKITDLPINISERYKQTCQYQVVGMLNSYISNVKLRFVDKVMNSSIENDVRIKLLYINKYKKWFSKEVVMKKNPIEPEILHLARHIFKKLTKNKPKYKSINLSLDGKVVKIIPSDGTTTFDYWLKISTLVKSKPVMIPLTTNEYFNSQEGIIKNSIQINKKNNTLTFSLIKSIDVDKSYVANKLSILGLDVGLVNLFATNHGDLLGKKAMNYIKNMDKIITKLMANLQKQNIKPNDSKRYVKLIKKVKSFIKNEINRVLNKLVKRYKPSEIHVEKLDFRGQNIGKVNNRLLNNFGKSTIRKKLSSLSECKLIVIKEKNPAYTSQECSNCHYTDKKNRKTQSEFVCKCCGLKINADVNASRNHVFRSSEYDYKSRSKILQTLTELNGVWRGQRGHSSAKDFKPVKV